MKNDNCSNIIFTCAKCIELEISDSGTAKLRNPVKYDYGKHKPVCAKCGTPLSDFNRDHRLVVIEAL